MSDGLVLSPLISNYNKNFFSDQVFKEVPLPGAPY